ncbi:hypothetical protein AX15_005515 [Amanita polypyramis BW_CC]|nr:hypothetical protein AX15_005515 [Amanita polypyramis BW_CC]
MSPARKRQRLSSPLSDGPICKLTQEETPVFDALESKLIHAPSSRPLNYRFNGRMSLGEPTTGSELLDDDENPFTAACTLPGFASASSLRGQSFRDDLQCSDDAQPEPGCEVGFKPASDAPFVGFQVASAVGPPPGLSSTTLGLASAGLGFSAAGKKHVYAPSKVALAAAQAKMRMWNENEDKQGSPTRSPNPTPADTHIQPESASSYRRPALTTLENAFNSPRTPLHTGVNKRIGNFDSTPISPLMERSRGQRREFHEEENIRGESSSSRTTQYQTPLSTMKPRYSKQFVSPLITPRVQSTVVEHGSPASSQNGIFSSVASQLPISQRHLSTPHRPELLAVSPIMTKLQPTAGSGVGAFKPSSRTFVTPFKVGIKPESTATPQYKAPLLKLPHAQSPRVRERPCFFNLIPPTNRLALKSSGLHPQTYNKGDLDVSLTELTQITPSLAPFYSFHTTSNPDNSLNNCKTLGPAAALDELRRRGCSLATKPWVDNHWNLILWKLAGMVLLHPDQEKDPEKRRWCWSEVMKQLLYRYERELNQGKRPALRKVTTRDAPAALPMTLCVSGIFWPEGGRSGDGLAIGRVPELEVTDGWYRLRAIVDPPIARAVGRGVIRVGRKLGIAGARLSSERKEPSEVLEAYNSSKLVLSGNSSHLMPWHAKLGFQHGPCISTLHSLSPEGGCVATADVVVIKAFPIAYIEFFDEGEHKRRGSPINEGEQMKLDEQWKKKRELGASKLRSDLEKRFNRLEGYMDRLNCRAGTKFHPGDDESPPDNVDELCDMLEDPTEANATIAKLGPTEAGWLARHVQALLGKEKETSGTQIERELQKLCPPRDVRSFRVVVVQDACTRRRPANRVAQITVWDVLKLSFEEGGSKGPFEAGQRYLVTNLIPTQQKAWMNREPGSEIFLSTRRDSRWSRLG